MNTTTYDNFIVEDRKGLSNFASKLTIPKNNAWEEVTSIASNLTRHKAMGLLQKWSMSAFPSKNYHSFMPSDDLYDQAYSVLEKHTPKIRPLLELFISLSPRRDFLKRTIEENLLNNSKNDFKALLVVFELLASRSYLPEIYQSKKADTVIEYSLEKGRVSMVINNSYCHVMTYKGAEISDRYFTGDDYLPQEISKYTADLLDALNSN